MSHRFDIHSLTLFSPIEKSRLFYLRIKVSESYWFKTAQQHINNLNVIPFLESNRFQIPSGTLLYYSIELVQTKPDGNYLIDKKMLFQKDINNKTTIQFFVDNIKAVLNYDFTVFISTPSEANTKKSGTITKELKKRIEQFTEMNSDTKLELTRLGGLTYSFVNRLDPVVKITNYLRQITKWTSPTHTILFATIATLVILQPRISIMVGCLAIIASKDRLLNLGEDLSQSRSEPRLIAPKQNFILLQTGMDTYCQVYEYVKDLFQNQDKTELILIINGIILNAWGLLLVPVFLGLADILIIGLWGYLLLQHPSGRQMKNVLVKINRELTVELAHFLQSYSFKFKVTTKLLKFIQMPEEQTNVCKTFEVYEFQQWWFGIWEQPTRGSTNKWSDATGKLRVLPRDKPPKGYSWTTEWTIYVDQTTDQNGFEYSTRLRKEFHPTNNILDTIRRRKWIRTCETQKNNNTQKLKFDWIVDSNLPASRAKYRSKRS